MKVSMLFTLILMMSVMSCARHQKSSEALAANKLLITSTFSTYMDSCWNKGDITSLKDITIENFIRNQNGINVATSQSEMQAHMTVFFTAFPDLVVTLDSTFVHGNAIFTHWTSTGTHTGMFGEIAATGKKVQINGLSQVYFNTNGKLVREDVVYNELQLLQQLGYTLTPPVME